MTDCELVGLSDLRTESDSVRTTIAGYLNKLMSYGVAGFRVDAAKHIGQADLDAIFKQAEPHQRRHSVRSSSWRFHRRTRASCRPSPSRGRATCWGSTSRDHRSRRRSTSNITDLKVFGEDAGLLPSDKTVPFVENHDTERDGSTLSYKSGATNTLATEFMLAYGYGTPQVYSGFVFANRDDSPPADANGFVTDTDCNNGWACTHRARASPTWWASTTTSGPPRSGTCTTTATT